ncbi:MAG: nitrite reductase [Magnetospirillum sp. WYHS-4]
MRAALFMIAVLFSTAAAADTARLYGEHCAACHGPDRLGGIGPALLPENLGRLKKEEAQQVVKAGRPASQMLGFGDKLSDEQIRGLVDLAFTPLKDIPDWGIEQMTASRVVHNDMAALPAKPVHGADPLNLFTVVEVGDHHVTILDGDRFEPLWRFQSRFSLHGGAKYSPDGRFVYLGSRDGWVSKYDLWSLKPVAEIRAGINMRNIAVSSDGKWVMAGNYLPHSLVVLNAHDLTPFKVIKASDEAGKTTSRVSGVYNAPTRNSFVAALKDIKEIWEMSYDPNAEPVYGGFVHSRQPGSEEGVPVEPQPFARRRTLTDDYLDDFFFDPTYTEAMGASRSGTGGLVYNLDARRKAAALDLDGMPHLGSGIVFSHEGRTVMATPHLKGNQVSVIDMESWKTIKKIPTKGPGFFMRSHENTPYAWTDVFFGPNKGTLHVIDKRTLEIVKDLVPEPGKTSAHVEFTRDGRHLLISVWEMDGWLLVYDAATFQEVKRLPMKKPSGKYNVYNKITYSSGTSH